jgi:hypothetical protein
MNASKKHLSAFQKQLGGNSEGSINQNDCGINRLNGKTDIAFAQNGIGNRKSTSKTVY